MIQDSKSVRNIYLSDLTNSNTSTKKTYIPIEIDDRIGYLAKFNVYEMVWHTEKTEPILHDKQLYLAISVKRQIVC